MFVHWSVRRSWGTADAEGSDDTAMGDKGQKRAPLAGLMQRSCAHQNPRGKIYRPWRGQLTNAERAGVIGQR